MIGYDMIKLQTDGVKKQMYCYWFSNTFESIAESVGILYVLKFKICLKLSLCTYININYK